MINRVSVMIMVLALLFGMAYISEAQVVTDGLVAYWPMDGGSAADTWGGHDGTIFGGPQTVAGLNGVNEALDFDGVDDYIEAEIGDNQLADGATLELWFRQERATDQFGVLLKIEPDKAELNVDPEREGRTELWCYESGGVEGAAGVRDGNWHHAVGAVSADGQVHYIDGVNVGENATPVVFDAVSKVVMGQRIPRGLWWKGTIDEVRIYGRPLSEGEVQQNMNAGVVSVEPVGKLAQTWGQIKSRAN